MDETVKKKYQTKIIEKKNEIYEANWEFYEKICCKLFYCDFIFKSKEICISCR